MGNLTKVVVPFDLLTTAEREALDIQRQRKIINGTTANQPVGATYGNVPNVADEMSTSTCYLIASVRLDKILAALGTRSNLSFANGFFNCHTTSGYHLLFHFLTTQWYMRWFSAFAA
jgi:hypothetical protein